MLSISGENLQVQFWVKLRRCWDQSGFDFIFHFFNPKSISLRDFTSCEPLIAKSILARSIIYMNPREKINKGKHGIFHPNDKKDPVNGFLPNLFRVCLINMIKYENSRTMCLRVSNLQ